MSQADAQGPGGDLAGRRAHPDRQDHVSRHGSPHDLGPPTAYAPVSTSSTTYSVMPSMEIPVMLLPTRHKETGMRVPTSLRLALAGTGLLFAIPVHARTGVVVLVGVQVSADRPNRAGAVFFLNPMLSLTGSPPDSAQLGVTAELGYFRHGGEATVKGQVGYMQDFGPCDHGVAGALPLPAVFADGGLRWAEGHHLPVAGAGLAMTPLPGMGMRVGLDRTFRLNDERSATRFSYGNGAAVSGDLPTCGATYRGRPLRTGGGAHAASARMIAGTTGSWSRAAEEELTAARTFAELAQSLSHHNAPIGLVRAALRSSLEEVAHAAACLILAALDSGSPHVVNFAPPSGRYVPSLGVLAAESWADGWRNEGQAAADAAQAASSSTNPLTTAIQGRIAADEARHSSYGLEVARWAVHAGGRASRIEMDAHLDRMQHASLRTRYRM